MKLIFVLVLAITATFISANDDTICHNWELPNFCQQDTVTCQVTCKGPEVSKLAAFKKLSSSPTKNGKKLCSFNAANDLVCNLRGIPDDRRELF